MRRWKASNEMAAADATATQTRAQYCAVPSIIRKFTVSSPESWIARRRNLSISDFIRTTSAFAATMKPIVNLNRISRGPMNFGLPLLRVDHYPVAMISCA
jgi:hypothetical protein